MALLTATSPCRRSDSRLHPVIGSADDAIIVALVLRSMMRTAGTGRAAIAIGSRLVGSAGVSRSEVSRLAQRRAWRSCGVTSEDRSR
jgi:hypothetical protein